MITQEVWEILEINETKNESEIRNAYRARLIQVNPEDDAEGFVKLRKAYEEALNFAKLQEMEEDTEHEKTEFDIWIDKADKIYSDIAKRRNIQLWKELLNENICLSLETADIAREHLLAYLMDHYHLPFQIWTLFDDIFNISLESQQLYEKFPQDFIDFVLRQIKTDNFFDYTNFQHDTSENADEFIQKYYKLRNALDAKKIEEAEDQLNEIKKWKSTHPYVKVEEMRLLLNKEEKEAALAIAEELLQQDGADNYYIAYFCAMVKIKNEQFQEGEAILAKLLEEFPNYYSAKLLLANSLYHRALADRKEGKQIVLFNKKDDLEDDAYPIRQAEEILFELYEVNAQDEKLNELLEKINRTKLEVFQKRLADYPEENSTKYEKAWSLFRIKEYQACTDTLLEMEEEEKDQYQYINLLGRAYLALGSYQQALPLVKKWISLIEATPNDGSKNSNDRHKILDYAYYALGNAYLELKNYEEAISSMESCLEATAQLSNQYLFWARERQAYCERKLENYEKCIEICNNLIEESKEYFPAYIHRQIAEFELRKDQEVINDYYAAIEIYAGVATPYVYAAEVFLAHRQSDNAAEVLERAEKEGVESNRLKLLAIQIKRITAEEDEKEKQLLEALNQCFELKKRIEDGEEDNDVEDSGKIDLEIVYCYIGIGKYKEALQIIKVAMNHILGPKVKPLKNKRNSLKAKSYVPTIQDNTKLSTTQLQMLYMRGVLYEDLDELHSAIQSYETLLIYDPDDVRAKYNIADCYLKLDKNGDKNDSNKEKAFKYYEDIASTVPDYRDVNTILLDHYRELYDQTEERQYYELALNYANRAIALNENVNTLINRALVYMDGYDFENAIKDNLKALEINPDEWAAANNIGFSYEIQRDMEKAIEWLKKSISMLGESDRRTPEFNLASCYFIMQKYEDSLNIYEKLHKRFPDNNGVVKKIAQCHEKMGRYEKAEEWYLKWDVEKWDKYQYIFDMWNLSSNQKKIKQYLAKLKRIARHEQKPEQYRIMAYNYHDIKNYRKMKFYLNKMKMVYNINQDPLGDTLSDMAEVALLDWLQELLKGKKKKDPLFNYRIKTCQKLLKFCGEKGIDNILKKYPEEKQKWDMRKQNGNQDYRGYFLQYFDSQQQRPRFMLRVATYLICLGEYEFAEELAMQSTREHKCIQCRTMQCGDAYSVLGMLCEIRGDYKQAVDYYKKQHKENNPSSDTTNKIKELEKLL